MITPFIIQLHWEQITRESSTVFGQLVIFYCKKTCLTGRPHVLRTSLPASLFPPCKRFGWNIVITRALQRERPSWNSGFVFFFRSVANRSQVLIMHAQPFDSDACATFWVISTWHGVMADDEKLSRCKISTDTVYNSSKRIQNMHTSFAVDPH